MEGYDRPVQDGFCPVKISSPTCEDLGIPRDCEEMCVSLIPSRIIQNPSLHIDGIRYEAAVKGTLPKNDPFSPLCMIPLPSPFTLDHLEPTFVRKRNERERERVRCVNDGYLRLKEHLPLENKEKRISKVETLRRAIEYIKYLQSLLADDDCDFMSDIASSERSASTFSDDSSEDDEFKSSVDTIVGSKNTCRIELLDYRNPDLGIIVKPKEEDDLSMCCMKRKLDMGDENDVFKKRKCTQNA